MDQSYFTVGGIKREIFNYVVIGSCYAWMHAALISGARSAHNNESR